MLDNNSMQKFTYRFSNQWSKAKKLCIQPKNF